MADLRMERVLWQQHCVVIGVDEAGRGPLAGPVVAGACILEPEANLTGVDDSKRLSPRRREAAYQQILAASIGWGVGVVPSERIDRVNIRNATLEAMETAVSQALAMSAWSDSCPFVLVDGNIALPSWQQGQRTVVGGDRKVLSIAAASILAKVTRDRLMIAYDTHYPEYGFARHKGYAAREHLEALDRCGPCPIHRITFIDHRQLKLF